jgi:hypothetical protein
VDEFGKSLAALGNDIVVGAPVDNLTVVKGGAAYLFEGVPEPPSVFLAGFAAGILWLGHLRQRVKGRFFALLFCLPLEKV